MIYLSKEKFVIGFHLTLTSCLSIFFKYEFFNTIYLAKFLILFKLLPDISNKVLMRSAWVEQIEVMAM